MFKIKVGNKYWNFREEALSNKPDLIESEREAEAVADFLKIIFVGKTIKLEKEDDNSFQN